MPPLLLLLEPLRRERRPPFSELEKPAVTETSPPRARDAPAPRSTLPALPWMLDPEPIVTGPVDSTDKPEEMRMLPEGFEELDPVWRVRVPLLEELEEPELMATEPLSLTEEGVEKDRDPDLPRALPPLVTDTLPPEEDEAEEPPDILKEPPVEELLEPDSTTM